MLSQSRALRGALVLLMSLGYVAYHGHTQVAFAAGDDDEEEDGGGDDGGDDGGGGKDEEGDEEGEEEEGQPPVTAGGLFNLKTYPVRELSRPLTITEKLFQARIGLGIDVSAQGAFKSYGVNVEGEYGFKDNVSGLFGFTNAYNFKQFGFYAGFEAALAYDLIDFRTAFRIGRAASANRCTAGVDCPIIDGMEDTTKLNGKYTAGRTQASIDVGFPFRYVAKPEIAIVALDTLLSFDLNDISEEITDPMTGKKTKVGDGFTPDLNPSLGIATNPIPALSVVIFAQLQIVDFDTDAPTFKVPATARVQFSPSQKLDIGGEFTFLNVKPKEGEGNFYDSRFLTLYVQFRAGK